MANNRDEIEDLMRRYGYQEKEAEAAYHLIRARDLLGEISAEKFAEERMSEYMSGLTQLIDLKPHFDALFSVLQRQVLTRAYPEGWGQYKSSEDNPDH